MPPLGWASIRAPASAATLGSCIQPIMSQAVDSVVINPARRSDGGVRSYPAPWKGQVVLACRKCQKKLKQAGKKRGMAKLSKELKSRTGKHEQRLELTVLDVPCLKLCPKGGVTVCTQQQLAKNRCSIMYNGADLDALVAQCRAESTAFNIQSRSRPGQPGKSLYTAPAYQGQSHTSS